MTLGERIQETRKKAGMKQSDLAEKLGVAVITIGQYERGKREPSLNQLLRISEELNVSLPYLVGVSDEKGRLFPEHLAFISPDDREFVKSILPNLSELDPLSDEESALKVLLNSMGDDLLKANGTYFFTYQDGGSIVSEGEIQELLSCAQNGLKIAAKNLELKLRQEAYQVFAPQPSSEPPQSPPEPKEGRDTTPPPEGGEGTGEGE